VIVPGSAKLTAAFDMVGDFGVWQGCAGGGTIAADGVIKTKGSIGAVGSIYCAGSMSANGMSSTSIHNGTGGGFAPNVESKGGSTEAAVNAAKDPLYREFEEDTLDDTEQGAGNQEVWDEIGFSFRTTEQYKATELKVYESRSQQLYRAYNLSTKWDEPVVKAPDDTETRPHPGNDRWTDGEAYQYADPADAKNLDYKTGVSKKREEQTEEGPELKKASMEDEYLVTVQST
jgi:hypothetical protein